MKRTIKRVISVFFAMMAITVAAESKWFDSVAAGGNRFWSEATGWKPTAGVPTSSDDIGLNSTNTTPANPLVITNGIDAVCGTLRIADHPTANYVSDGRIPSLHMSGGSLHAAQSWLWDAVSVGHHTNGYGLLTLSGGTLSNKYLTVGASGIGVMTNDGGAVELASELFIGLRTTGQGTYVQQSGTFKGAINIGYKGTGILIHAGGTVTNLGYMYVGRESTSDGRLDVCAPGLSVPPGHTLLIGYEGRGVLEQRANLDAGYLKIGGSTNVTSVATIYAGATNSVYSTCNIGGYRMFVGEGIEPAEKPGNGVLLLKGGILKIVQYTTDVVLYVGRFAESCGRLQGWGIVEPAWSGATNVRMLLGNGVIQADGEGEARTLDLHSVVSVTNNLPNSADGTNGWYAVNKGRVLYPRTWFGNENPVTRCIGDWSRNTAPALVNSVCATFTGITSTANFFRGGLYATDREDIPAGLPENSTTVGVWQLGLYKDLSTWSASHALIFSSVALTFRYDQTRVKSHQTLTLYRHTGSAWVKVGGGSVEAEHLISTDAPLSRLTGADANIGWFALVARDSGTVIMVN